MDKVLSPEISLAALDEVTNLLLEHKIVIGDDYEFLILTYSRFTCEDSYDIGNLACCEVRFDVLDDDNRGAIRKHSGYEENVKLQQGWMQTTETHVEGISKVLVDDR